MHDLKNNSNKNFNPKINNRMNELNEKLQNESKLLNKPGANKK